jgi:tetratricopeptide (TPR) repeat protein
VSNAGRLDELGAQVAFVSIDSDEDNARTPAFLSSVKSPAKVLRATDKALAAWNTVHRRLFSWRRDLVVPTSFLIDADGRIVKVYRGRTPASSFVRDVQEIPTTETERVVKALPFPGRVLKTSFRRDVGQLAAALNEAGLPTLARATYASMTGSTSGAPTNVDTMFNVAITTAASGDVEEARRLYLEILRLRPDSDDALVNLGMLALGEEPKRIAEARRYFEEALSHNPANNDAALNLATTYLAPASGPEDPERERKILQNAQRALQILRDLLRHDPESPRVLARIWRAHFILGDRAAAIRSLDEALRVDPRQLDCYLNLSILYIAEGQPQRAADKSREGLLLDAGHAGLHHTLGKALADLGKDDAAITELRKALRADPRFDRPYFHLAELHMRAGDRDAAIAVLEELLRELPGHPRAKSELSKARGE